MSADLEGLSRRIAGLRVARADGGLEPSDLDPDPVVQFGRWLAEALEAGLRMPNEMALATAGPDGVVSARMVLLKGVDERGFVFYTNRASRKGRDLAANPRAALVFYWADLERQVTVQGGVEEVGRTEAEAYWRSRPIGSRLSAWASRQSEVLESRAALEARVAELARRFGDDPPLPPHWGGYRVVPDQVEFWQARPDRLHDRLRYRREGGAWVIERLYP